MKEKFKGILNNKFSNSNDFKRRIAKTQYLTARNNTWLKFFILAAMHDTVTDDKNPGLDKKGSQNCNPTLTLNKWQLSDPLTIEHIAPQRPENPAKWDNNLLLPDYMHSIGNLTLLPKQKNSIAGNKDWSIKRELYSILSDPDPERRVASIIELEKKYQIEITNNTKKSLKKAEFWVDVKSLTKVKTWNKDIVEKRAERLAELGWNNLSPWLGY